MAKTLGSMFYYPETPFSWLKMVWKTLRIACGMISFKQTVLENATLIFTSYPIVLKVQSTIALKSSCLQMFWPDAWWRREPWNSEPKIQMSSFTLDIIPMEWSCPCLHLNKKSKRKWMWSLCHNWLAHWADRWVSFLDSPFYPTLFCSLNAFWNETFCLPPHEIPIFLGNKLSCRQFSRSLIGSLENDREITSFPFLFRSL